MDRKSLIRQYKEARQPMGVFQVRNTRTGRVFVGSSIDLPSILNRLRSQLRLGGHPDRALQEDWRSMGDDAFAFEVLDTLAPPDEPTYDPTDRASAMAHLQERQAAGEVVTGLLYVDPNPEDLHVHLKTVTQPLNRMNAKELCPGSGALADLNAGYR